MNIGIKMKGVGTAADADENFELRLEDDFRQDTPTFSAIGHQELSVLVRDVVSCDRHQFLQGHIQQCADKTGSHL